MFNPVREWDGPFGIIRTILVEDAPWFIAADVCRALDIMNPTDALTRLDDDEHTLVSTEGIPGARNPQANIVSEAGLYALVLGSRKPEARAFKRWVTHEVLPAIRKTGAYQTAPSVPRTFAEALQLAADQARTIERQIAQIELARPAVEAHKQLRGAEGSCGIRTTAKQIGARPKAFVQWLLEKGILFREDGRLLPKAQQVNLGRFCMVTGVVEQGEKSREVASVMFTPAGLSWVSIAWKKDHPDEEELQLALEAPKPKRKRKKTAANTPG